MPIADTATSTADRIQGGLLGLLLGDAIGVPHESHPRDALPPAAQIDLQPPLGYRRAHRHIAPGTWSDDGAEALVLLTSLLDDNGLDLPRFATRLNDWLQRGFCAVDGRAFGSGRQTRAALARFAAGVDAAGAGGTDERGNGNGSLMRVLPLALWHRGDNVELMRLAARQSLPTHGHPRAQACCALYCLWARGTLAGAASAWDDAVTTLRTQAAEAGLDADEVAYITDATHAERVRGSGYVVDTLWSAHWANSVASTYADCVRHAIGLGHDTDTTAAVAGGIAGLRAGASGIPDAWREGLRGRSIYAPLLQRLLAHRARPDRHGQPDFGRWANRGTHHER